MLSLKLFHKSVTLTSKDKTVENGGFKKSSYFFKIVLRTENLELEDNILDILVAFSTCAMGIQMC